MFNTIIGAMLLLGMLTRIASTLAALHLIAVIVTIGYNDISIRDFGLLLATISVLLHGSDNWCLDNKIFKKK